MAEPEGEGEEVGRTAPETNRVGIPHCAGKENNPVGLERESLIRSFQINCIKRRRDGEGMRGDRVSLSERGKYILGE